MNEVFSCMIAITDWVFLLTTLPIVVFNRVCRPVREQFSGLLACSPMLLLIASSTLLLFTLIALSVQGATGTIN